ncbi:MAG: glycosyltransferase involved in cell wall biosynthesis [Moritella sp.]|jgi:glycosyltransferase involved in cell wall biosynthesis
MKNEQHSPSLIAPTGGHKTIIQVVQHLRPGGIETLSLDLASFSAPSEKTIIISLEGNIETAINAWPRLKPFKDQLIFLNKQPGLKPSLVMQLRNIFKDLNADTVHTHHIGPLLYAGLAARLARVKHLIHTEHDAWHLQQCKRRVLQRWAFKLLQPILTADADTVANTMRMQLRCSNNITVIRNGIDTEYFIPGDPFIARQHLKLPPQVQLIGCSGRLEQVKGQSVLIHALSKLPPTIHLVFAGAGSTEHQLRKQVDQLKLNKRVHFLGRIDNMPLFYQSLDIFCLPSLNEGFPLAPLEAQACNIPTVVTNVGGSQETVCPHSSELIPANDHHSMATALNRMLQQPKDCQPRAFVQRHCDVRLMVKAYATLRDAGSIYA